MLRPRKRSLKLVGQKVIASEYEECKAFWQYILLEGMELDWIHHANERIGDPGWFIKALERIGFRKGLVDYQYIVANDKFCGLWLEFKRSDQRSRKKPAEQQAFIDRLIQRNHFACFVYTAEEAIKVFLDYKFNRL